MSDIRDVGILVVELKRTIYMGLETAGYSSLYHKRGGLEGLAAYDPEVHDVVLVGRIMDMSYDEFTRRIREKSPDGLNIAPIPLRAGNKEIVSTVERMYGIENYW